MDFLRRFFGMPNKPQQFDTAFVEEDKADSMRSTRFPDTNDSLRRPSFHVFSDPLHMQQYFEYQINEMLKLFGFPESDTTIFSNFYSNVPALEDNFNSNEGHGKDLRDQFLKSGYEKPSQKPFEKRDKDIDGRVQLDDIDSVFGRKNLHESTPSTFFFGKSQSIKTVTNPDGSVETHRTMRDNEGNEETTLCKKIGEKEYCIIKKKDKHGKEQIVEKFVNMDAAEKDALFTTRDKLVGPDEPYTDFPFDKFFR